MYGNWYFTSKYNKMMSELYEEVSDDQTLPFDQRYELTADIPQSELNRKKQDSNYSSNSLIDDLVDGLAEKNQSILAMKDNYVNDFYEDVVAGRVGRQTIFGGIAKGSASIYDQYRYGAWMNWYYHNLALAYNSKDFDRADEIRLELSKINVEIEDTKEGTKWKKLK